MQIKIEAPDTLERIASALERIAAQLEKVSTTTPAQIAESVKPAAVETAEAPQSVPETAPEEVKATTPEPAQEAAGVSQKPETEQQPQQEAAQSRPAVTLDQIRKMVVTLSARGAEVKAKVRETVTAYGRNVSAIPADKYSEVMDKLTALQEG